MFKKVKEHVKRNKSSYTIGGACLVVGTGVGLAVSKRMNIVNIDLFNKIKDVGVYKPTYQINLARRGHAGNVIVCHQTGEMFASQGRAAQAMDIAKSSLSKHLNGATEHVNGYTFEKVGDFNVQE